MNDDSATIGDAIAAAVLDTLDATFTHMTITGDPIANAITDLVQITWQSVLYGVIMEGEEPEPPTLMN